MAYRSKKGYPARARKAVTNENNAKAHGMKPSSLAASKPKPPAKAKAPATKKAVAASKRGSKKTSVAVKTSKNKLTPEQARAYAKGTKQIESSIKAKLRATPKTVKAKGAASDWDKGMAWMDTQFNSRTGKKVSKKGKTKGKWWNPFD